MTNPSFESIVSTHGIRYRKIIDGKYKYELVDAYTVRIVIATAEPIDHPYYALALDGTLTAKARYQWDGPSGPTIDTPDFMRGSLVHDVLYQMMRERQLPLDRRKRADEILYETCREDGMGWLRAKYVYLAVRWFGAAAATPKR